MALSLFSFSAIAEEVLAYTINFENTRTADDNNALTTSNFISKVVKGGAEYVSSCTETNKCYDGKGALKLGSASVKGFFGLSLSEAGQVNATKVVIYTAKFRDSDADNFECTINNGTPSTLKITDVNTIIVNSKIQTIKIAASAASNNRFYLTKIEVYKNADGNVEVPAVAKPAFSVASKKFSEPFNLTLSCATEGAKIYYTFVENGKFEEYTTALNIKETTTIYAKAVLGTDESEVVSATYTYVNPVVTIAEFLKAEVNDGILYELTGVVYDIYNTSYGNFYLTNETDTVLVYGLKANATAGNQSFAEIKGLDEGDTLTLRGYRAAYNGKAQVGSAYYVSHKDVVQVVELPEVDNIAALVELNQKARIKNAVTVIAQTGKYLWVKDASMSMLVYGTAPATYKNGDQLTGLVATVTTYNGATQLTPVEFPEAVAGTAVEPTVVALADVVEGMVHQYIKLEGVTYTNATTLTAGDNTLTMYNDRFKYTYAGEEGDKVNVVAIVGYYNALQVYPISIEKVVVEGPTTTVNVIEKANIYTENGMIMAEGEFEIYTVTGQNVTGMNGNLENGVYVVRTANATVKVVVK